MLFALRKDDFALPWRLGMAVTRKTGSAVWRNRVRRLIREVFRLAQDGVPPGYDYVVVPKRCLLPRTATLATVTAELLPLLRALSSRKAGSAGATRTQGGE